MYITNNEEIAKVAEKCGVEWIFIDLENIGKQERQGHLDTVISHHSIEDIRKIKQVLTKSEVLVRINPIYEGSKYEINKVIEEGADIVMLPYFMSKEEVEWFVKYVNKRAKTCLLLETAEAVENIESILTVEGIDFIHIGLNDLHLSYNMKFMFELLTNGTVEMLCQRVKSLGIPYGFGGIAQIGKGILPAENIIAEHYRLGSSMTILSRSFCNTTTYLDVNQIEDIFQKGINEIRNYEEMVANAGNSFFDKNQKVVREKVVEIIYTTPKK
jgi:2-keto-3-deoxy-L-rhamnonate aldolase RhmA